ncbi:hypothetical protein EK0264_18405 [Epidermidibacterium keratini]|uniref:Uncharacterized protein n=1 Tax=Epidermidibacterium keratini TaxID=1891644 RepID=A0A7L4YS25_9ACTN|nr:hypothetical protein [Epidermidibacterium keratini]QHC02051.1 hypothetical protein EK0264_18405 [Epidermidibacterium keratini]
MVLWICVGVVVLGLGVLAVLLFDLKGKADRLKRAVALTDSALTPQVEIVRAGIETLQAREESETAAPTNSPASR